MLRLHHIGATYGTLPSDVVGLERGSWASWIVNVCAQQVGDEGLAAMVQRAGAFPVVPLR